MKNILLVDDEPLILQTLKELLDLHSGDFKVLTAENGRQASGILAYAPVDLVITDLNMPEMDGFQLLAFMAGAYPHIPAIAMSAAADGEAYEKLRVLGVSRFVGKPFSFSELMGLIRSCFAEGPRTYSDSIATGLAL